MRGKVLAKNRVNTLPKPLNCEDKKSGVLSLMFVHDADIEGIEPQLLKDKL
jgi:hypothetical protein